MTAAVEIYTRPGCGYCSAALALLTRKNVTFTHYDAATDPSVREQIFIDGTHIGGCDDLYALDRVRKLDAMLAGEGEGVAS